MDMKRHVSFSLKQYFKMYKNVFLEKCISYSTVMHVLRTRHFFNLPLKVCSSVSDWLMWAPLLKSRYLSTTSSANYVFGSFVTCSHIGFEACTQMADLY